MPAGESPTSLMHQWGVVRLPVLQPTSATHPQVMRGSMSTGASAVEQRLSATPTNHPLQLSLAGQRPQCRCGAGHGNKGPRRQPGPAPQPSPLLGRPGRTGHRRHGVSRPVCGSCALLACHTSTLALHPPPSQRPHRNRCQRQQSHTPKHQSGRGDGAHTTLPAATAAAMQPTIGHSHRGLGPPWGSQPCHHDGAGDADASPMSTASCQPPPRKPLAAIDAAGDPRDACAASPRRRGRRWRRGGGHAAIGTPAAPLRCSGGGGAVMRTQPIRASPSHHHRHYSRC